MRFKMLTSFFYYTCWEIYKVKRIINIPNMCFTLRKQRICRFVMMSPNSERNCWCVSGQLVSQTDPCGCVLLLFQDTDLGVGEDCGVEAASVPTLTLSRYFSSQPSVYLTSPQQSVSSSIFRLFLINLSAT